MTLNLNVFREEIVPPDEAASAAAAERQAALAKPPGSLGRLESLSLWVASVQGESPPHPFRAPRLVVFAGDHGVTRQGVSAYPPQVTAAMLRAFLSGGAAANVLAAMSDVALRVVDLSVDDDLVDIPESVTRFKVMRGSGNIAVENAMTEEQSEKAFTQGMAIADEEIDSGADLLITGDMGIGNTTPAAVLIAALTGSDAATVTGRGTGIDDNAWMRKCASIRDALRRARPILGDQIALLAAVGGADIAAMSGFIAQSARRRTPVLLDGVVSGAAALVAHRIAYRAAHWWAAGHLSVEPAHATALTRLSLEPIVDFGMRLGEGTGALVALPVLQAAAGTLAGMATLADLGIASTDG